MSETNLWEIRGKYGQFIKLKFIELDVNNQIFGIVDSFVEVFDIGLNKERSSSMGRFTKVTKPHVELLSSWRHMQVVTIILYGHHKLRKKRLNNKVNLLKINM
jgi:hypothetical protein